jgi:hypothetical protein
MYKFLGKMAKKKKKWLTKIKILKNSFSKLEEKNTQVKSD